MDTPLHLPWKEHYNYYNFRRYRVSPWSNGSPTLFSAFTQLGWFLQYSERRLAPMYINKLAGRNYQQARLGWHCFRTGRPIRWSRRCLDVTIPRRWDKLFSWDCSRASLTLAPPKSHHTASTPNFENICCRRREPCHWRDRARNFADRSLCDPGIKWRDICCIAAVWRWLWRVHWRVCSIQSSAPLFPVAYHRREQIWLTLADLANMG